MASQIQGFAIRRNNSCQSTLGEVDCGPTANSFHACCPGGSFCPSTTNPNNYNAYCCSKAQTNCTQSILDTGPYCANSSWSLYDNNGFFCCDVASQGYGVINAGDGCASQGYQLKLNENYLPVLPAKSNPFSATSSSKPSDSQSSTTNLGAIIGGIVGGIAVIVIAAIGIFILIRRSRKQSIANSTAPPSAVVDEAYPLWQQDPRFLSTLSNTSHDTKSEDPPSELEAPRAVAEVPASTPVVELPTESSPTDPRR